MSTSSVLLTTARLDLKILCPDDVELVVQYLRENRNFLKEWVPRMQPSYYESSYHAKKLGEPSENGFKFYLFKKGESSRVVGDIGVSNIVYGAFQSCHLGAGMLGTEINNGFMTEAVKAVVKYVFDEVGLHRIEANVMPKNVRSKRMMEKLGFVNEGLSRKYLKISGQWEDHERYVIWNEE